MNRFAYSGFMFLALAVFLIVRALMPRHSLQREPWRKRLGIALGAFIGGAFGAKLPFVFDAEQGPLLGWISDGKTITTGLMGAYLGVEIAKWLLDVRIKTGDTFALPLACAMAVGRWGCFFHGCCHGAATDLPWGRDFGDGVSRHPTQAYESVFHLTMAVVLWFCLRHGWFRGNQLKLYLITYGIFRFATEYIRPEPEVFAGLTFYQWASVVMIVGLSAQWIFDRREESAGVQHQRREEGEASGTVRPALKDRPSQTSPVERG
jgi:phosphatidylglycerol:prolipoprotein diacylglycerol transferase